MNVENLTEAYYINNAIKELQRQKGILESGDGLGVTIQSTYQDKAFLDAIRPHAVAELNRRIEEKKASLVKLGLSFS
ncbi:MULTISPECIES: hypothetical protein [Citrobacter freundii complex]|uniref:hypothetical protein n=1 Tax=Citrobacter freundii complex TaxID=1344959 RepID=UPI0010A34548|nr:hypothetical protein [Citrobacter freundii]EJD6096061.1 hypothetical protein [Citrobacter freundii]EKS9221424.1 hypothetical protein [Citrobacter freundii]ELK6214059.1 hypothetical protein [Citrobacter freundii]MBJ8816900.1 hypothetical protein [Citrobacter freundii]MDU5553203.1 hypothetical protein [Citrobacter freundii]